MIKNKLLLQKLLLMNLAEEYSHLLKKIKALQNGPVADSLVQLGGAFCLNFGLSVDQIKGLSLPYKKNNPFAWYLWDKDVREAKLIALMIFDINKLSRKETDNMVYSFYGPEMVEQAVINLLVNRHDALTLIEDYCQNESEFVKMTGYSLMARLSIKQPGITNEEFEDFLRFIENDSRCESMNIKRAISFALRKLGMTNKENKRQVLLFCHNLEKIENNNSRWIAFDTLLELE